jgi:two-component system cell cycle sensor histidine kinase/response regulator CckA
MSEKEILILVVDDEAEDCESCAAALHQEGYTVLQAADSTRALTICEAQAPRIDLLVTDISLPVTNGCELAKELLKRYPELKVLFVSGYVGAEVCRYYGIPVTDLFFLRKPFQPAELVERVRRVLESNAPVPLKAENSDTSTKQPSV